eukprot:537817-Pelagomonas_calceolata.AAC.2
MPDLVNKRSLNKSRAFPSRMQPEMVSASAGLSQGFAALTRNNEPLLSFSYQCSTSLFPTMPYWSSGPQVLT